MNVVLLHASPFDERMWEPQRRALRGFPRCGHLPSLERSEEFNRLLLDFLRDV
jgi:hypothetical protein